MRGAIAMMMGSRLMPLAVQATPATVNGGSEEPSPGPVVVSSDYTTVVVVSGPSNATYAYSWAWVSGTGGTETITVTDPASATTAFSLLMNGDTYTTSIWRCTVTNNLGQAATADVVVNLSRA